MFSQLVSWRSFNRRFFFPTVQICYFDIDVGVTVIAGGVNGIILIDHLNRSLKQGSYLGPGPL
jgi:hypothetical protein